MLKVENIEYKTKQTKILRGVSLQVHQGEFVGVIGPNGSGKSTLLKNIYRMLTPTSGEILLDGKSLIKMSNRKMAERLAVVAQESEANFDFTVGEVVQMGRYPRKKMMEAANDEDREIVKQSLGMVGMDEFLERSFLTLSGGEKQRVLIARALAQETEMIILDEPTNHLDIASKEILESALNRYEGTVLFVSHDRYFINRTATRILNLTEQSIVNYIGNYDYYLEKKEINERAYLASSETEAAVSTEEVSEGKTDWQSQKEEQAKKRKIQNRVKKIEAEIESLEEKLAELDEQFQDPEVATNSAKLGKLHGEQMEAQEKLDKLYEEWEELASD